MPRIQHIALVAHDSEKTAEFYKTAFGMEEAHRHMSAATKDRPAIYLTDGYINLAILPILDRPEGIYHFGFQVDDVSAALGVAVNAGAKPPHMELPRDGRQAETFVTDPVGIKVDISRGWIVTPSAQTAAREPAKV